MERPIIETNKGKVQGITLKSVLGENYLAFRGIPFAEPPLGELRFKEPQEPKNWSGVRDASSFAGEIATQFETVGQPPFKVIGGEDCLYLNVYTNSIARNKPVMFYIHGGGFVEGNGNIMLKEDYFVSLDLVLVFVNYRLGPLGFLNLGHEVSPGNQGLKDIILALKWNQKNIESFGGDPNNVTIFGNSCGSIICHLFTMLPVTKGLFHKAILQSGSVYWIKSILTGEQFKNGFKIASLLGMDSDDPEKVVKFLRTVPAEKLVSLEGMILSEEDMACFQTVYRPVVDVDYTKNPIIHVPLRKLLKEMSDIPLMLGQTDDEFLVLLVGKLKSNKDFEYYDKILEYMLKTFCLDIEDPKKLTDVLKFTRDYYFRKIPINADELLNFYSLLNDIVRNANRKIIDLRLKYTTAPTFYYNFSYLGNEPTFYTYDRGPQSLKGVAHGDELSYMFNIEYMKQDRIDKSPKKNSTDWLVMRRLTKMWFNFASTGNPNPVDRDADIPVEWKPISKNSLYYLDIGNELVLKNDVNLKNREYYEKIKDYFVVRNQ